MSDSMTPMGETTPTFMRETPLTNATWLYPPRRVIEHSPGLYVWESTAPDLPCLSAIVSGNLGRRRKRPTESVALSTAPHDRRIHDMGGTNVAHFGRPFRADAITNVPQGLKTWAILSGHFMAAQAWKAFQHLQAQAF
jgi:hypothetical protein